MSRRRTPPRTPPPRRASTGSGPAGARVWRIVFALLGVTALVWWAYPRLKPASTAGGAGVRAIPMDSVNAVAREFDAATASHDWARALELQTRIAATLPKHPLVLRQLAQTLHNHQVAVTLPDGQTGWLLRTSLDRAAHEMHALALLDSSDRVSETTSDRALAHYWKGCIADYQGLPLDALSEYEAARALAPQDTSLAGLCRRLRARVQSSKG